MKKHVKFIIGGVIIVIAAAALGYAAFMGGGTYYYEVGEYLDKGASLTSQNTRVSGEVSADLTTETDMTTRFSLLDMTGRPDAMVVVYRGQLPDTFEVGRQVVVEGKLGGDGIFEAINIISKCSSKYEPE